MKANQSWFPARPPSTPLLLWCGMIYLADSEVKGCCHWHWTLCSGCHMALLFRQEDWGCVHAYWPVQKMCDWLVRVYILLWFYKWHELGLERCSLHDVHLDEFVQMLLICLNVLNLHLVWPRFLCWHRHQWLFYVLQFFFFNALDQCGKLGFVTVVPVTLCKSRLMPLGRLLSSKSLVMNLLTTGLFSLPLSLTPACPKQ